MQANLGTQLLCGLERAYGFLNIMSKDDARGGVTCKSKTKGTVPRLGGGGGGGEVAILSFGGWEDSDERERLQGRVSRNVQKTDDESS